MSTANQCGHGVRPPSSGHADGLPEAIRLPMRNLLMFFSSRIDLRQARVAVYLESVRWSFSEHRRHALSHWDQNLSQPGLVMGLYYPRISPSGIELVKFLPYRRQPSNHGKMNEQQSYSVFGSSKIRHVLQIATGNLLPWHLDGVYTPYPRLVRSAHSMTWLSWKKSASI